MEGRKVTGGYNKIRFHFSVLLDFVIPFHPLRVRYSHEVY